MDSKGRTSKQHGALRMAATQDGQDELWLNQEVKISGGIVTRNKRIEAKG